MLRFLLREQKSKKERIQQRQALLEKEEEERLKVQEAAETAGGNSNEPRDGAAAATKTNKLLKKKTGFVDREKAKFQMKLRIAKSIKRNRMPVQIRILPTVRVNVCCVICISLPALTRLTDGVFFLL